MSGHAVPISNAGPTDAMPPSAQLAGAATNRRAHQAGLIDWLRIAAATVSKLPLVVVARWHREIGGTLRGSKQKAKP